jgi:chaperonin cofactor prefoldin
MDYYQPPTDHRNAAEMERLQEQLDALIKQRQHLETLEYTEAVEIQHAAVEEQISFLRGLAKEIQYG